MIRKFFFVAALTAAVVAPAFAQEKKAPYVGDGLMLVQQLICWYNGKQYTEGAFLCTTANYTQRCTNGAWSDGKRTKEEGEPFCNGAFNGEKK